MRKFFALFTKELRRLVRDPQYLFMQLVLPGLAVVLFGVLLTITLRKVPVVVVDRDGGAEAREAIRELGSSPYFEIERAAHPVRALEDGTALASVTLGHGYGRARATGRPELQILVDGANPAASAVVGYLQAFLADLAARTAPGLHAAVAPVTTAVWYNPERRDAFFFIPGIIALLLFTVPAVFCATSLVSEKENGTWDSLGAAPVGDFQILAGKLGPYYAQGLIQAAVLFALAVYAFDLPVRGSLGLLLIATFLFVTSSIGLGGVFAALSPTENDAWRLLQIFGFLPALILSGFIYPLSSMPWVAQALSHVFPLRSYVELLRGLMLKGADLQDLTPQLLTLALFAGGTLFLAVTLLRRSRRIP